MEKKKRERSFCDFLKEADKEEIETYKGGKRRANLLTAITAGVRKYNVVNSTFSRTDSFSYFFLFLSLPLSLSLSLPSLPFTLSSPLLSLSLSLSLSLPKIISGQSFCNPIDPTGHIRVVTVMPLIESQSYLLNPLAHDKFDKSDLTKSSAVVTF